MVLNSKDGLNSNGLFLEDVENVVFSMKEFALQSDINKLLPINKEQLFISEMKERVYADKVFDEIKDILNDRLKNTEKDLYESMLVCEDWGEQIERNIIDNKYKRRKSIIHCIEPEKLAEKLYQSDNNQITHFRVALATLYKNSDLVYCFDELAKLEKMQTILENRPAEDAIQNWLLGLLVKDIDRYIKAIKEANNFQPKNNSESYNC